MILRSPVFFDLQGDGPNGPVPKGPFIALAPGADVTCHTLDMPARVPMQARPAIAKRQLEDRFAMAGVELYPLVAPNKAAPTSKHANTSTNKPASKSAWSQVVVVDANLAAAWRERLAPYGGQCRALIPDYLALPLRSGSVGTLWALPARSTKGPSEAIVRLSEDCGFRAEWDLAMTALSLTARLPETLDIFGPLSDQQRADLDALPTQIASQETAVPSWDQIPPPRIPAVNLLEDDAARLRQMQNTLRRWSLPAALAALAVFAWTATLWYEVQAGQQQLARYADASTRLVRQYFIPNGPLLDLRAQVLQVTAAARTAPSDTPQVIDPMPLMRALAAPLAASSASVEQILYTAPQAGQPPALSVRLHLASFAELDTLLAALRAQPLAVTLTQSSADPTGGVQTQLQVAHP